jgi:hypothetical protein
MYCKCMNSECTNLHYADTQCSAEVWAWDYFKDTQVDPHWIRCSLTYPHIEHEDQNTGLTWNGDS